MKKILLRERVATLKIRVFQHAPKELKNGCF
jgi:hypothetical protein